MSDLTITKAKPNPIGKDRMGNTVPSAQLAGEWIDFKNTDYSSFSLTNVELQHIAYTVTHPRGVWLKVMSFKGSLPAGKVTRVHSGGKVPLSLLPQIDVVGADYHLFTGKGYVWNNNQNDCPRLVLHNGATLSEIDKAAYTANSAEGKILARQGEFLV